MRALKKHSNIKWPLFIYDILILFMVEMLLLVFSGEPIPLAATSYQVAFTFACAFSARFIGKVYSQIWRYGGIQCYMRLLVTDAAGFFFN